MRLTTKGRYAVTAMLDLALHSLSHPIKPVRLNDIANRQAISLSYLEQLFSKLRKNNIVKSVRGPSGGYCLTLEPNAISIARVINAVNENLELSRCQGRSDCHQGQQCLTHNLWVDLSERIHHFLSHITLGELIEHHHLKKEKGNKSQSLLKNTPILASERINLI
jgi:Rrf2 family iron-sulfur cluster assembly transcriptional regulator